ncbi:M43 family zinc metalloprotease [Flavobacterium capsici]|uniref:M43 family zinc metalloprotease n=1 Tax=Flavobacterium capsici TaxID=3075618 RepID=A0AA96F1G5_9FLAO|nr:MULTISPECIES: M43 family zinc metalloprotease [unclassified Flavobacterium]WNM19814.1 M43 family zinc metalloprotease [Flavobacterium sp. PMR2A8]WNM21203.1 M43 family zinc metalloprotease [Flavobacterium sp. PMTSA4]
MKKITIIVLFLSSFFGVAQRTCHTSEKLAELIQNNPEFATHHQETMDFIQNPDNNTSSQNRTTNVVYTIPVVVHVLYKNSTQNISDAQILSQITILNNDFRKLNSDFNTVVPAAFQTYGADMEINFCMATRTPAGVATTGIERKSIATSVIFEDSYYTSTGLVAWDPTKYLNIWVGRFTDNQLLGFAYLPSAAGAAFDGLCIGDQFFGNTGTATAPYNKGRTATHEIGHYFGLLHPWGNDGSACGSGSNSDGVADTPATNNPYFSCPSYPNNANACTVTATGSMFMNYMDYVNDACMAFFTNGQKTILTNTINGPRASLKTSNGCQSLSVTEQEAIQAIAVYPNPVSQYFMITSPQINVDFVEIFATNGQLVKSQKLDEVNNKIYIDNLESGVYFLRIYNEDRLLKSDKIIKK